MTELRLPLSVDPNSFLPIVDADGRGIASAANMSMAHLLVRAVNHTSHDRMLAHDRLLAALRGMIGFNILLLNRKDLPADIPYMLMSNHRVKEAVAAIAAAEELAP